MLTRRSFHRAAGLGSLGGFLGCAQGFSRSREEVIDQLMIPLDAAGSTGSGNAGLEGRLFCGYQGWFSTPGDGSGRPWFHYGKGGRFEPGCCHIDLWPDTSELDEAEKYATPFRHRDGSVAHVFSSLNRQTVLRHFRWMREASIDGAFVQRFTSQVRGAQPLFHSTTVLRHCREGANLHGRAYAVMYDTAFDARSLATVREDWQLLVDRMRITSDRGYLRRLGRPVVALWGYGFPHREWDPAAAAAMLRFLNEDKAYGGAAVMLGVPTGWRTLDRDARPQPETIDLIRQAAIISPWTVGRYRTPEAAARHSRERWQPDLEWCDKRNACYLPVAFPGFSWHNMKPESPLNQIPRLKGVFFSSQLELVAQAGAASAYVAMFDEMDEGTAIFKCTDDPPAGASPFLNCEGLSSDHYLRLARRGRELLQTRNPARAGRLEVSHAA